MSAECRSDVGRDEDAQIGLPGVQICVRRQSAKMIGRRKKSRKQSAHLTWVVGLVALHAKEVSDDSS